LIEQEIKASEDAKDAKTALDTKTVKQYAKLTGDEIKLLLVEDKWLSTLRSDVMSELDRASQALAGRVKLLTERYATPLPRLMADAEMLSKKVEAHLKRMGHAA
jgi:type I restriction enzyme M protein